MSFETVLFLVFVGSLIVTLWRRLTIITVHEFQHALRFRRGKFFEVLRPGIYWYLKPLSSIELLDKRPTFLTVPGQELLSSDSVTLKVSTLIEYRIVDPKVVILESEDYMKAIYAKVQTQLRLLIGTCTIEELLASRAELSKQLESTISPEVKVLGVEVISVAIKDVMLPGSLKEAFSQVARAKQASLAALEHARGEAASLRKLANAARMLEGNPQIFQLRLLQVASNSGKLSLTITPPGDARIASNEGSAA